MAESLIAKKKVKKKASKKIAKKVSKKTGKKAAKKKAPKPESTKARQKELNDFEAPKGFRFSANASQDTLEKCAEIDLLTLKVADAARDLTRIRKDLETAQNDLKKRVQGEDPTGTLFGSPAEGDDGEGS